MALDMALAEIDFALINLFFHGVESDGSQQQYRPQNTFDRLSICVRYERRAGEHSDGRGHAHDECDA